MSKLFGLLIFGLFFILSVSAEQITINKGSYVVQYDTDRCDPNYVGWDLPAKSPRFIRAHKFYVEPGIPSCARPSEYNNSGYDKGHLCPSADKGQITFSMINVVPQTPGLNRGPWKDLENYCRRLHIDLHIMAGDYGILGKLDSRIAIPSHCWKIIQDSSGNVVAAVDMPNINIKGHRWQEYSTTVEDINKHMEQGE